MTRKRNTADDQPCAQKCNQYHSTSFAVFEIYHCALDPGEITEPCSYTRRPLSVGTHQVRSLETARQKLIEAVSNSQTRNCGPQLSAA
jgi:hypothetical protein